MFVCVYIYRYIYIIACPSQCPSNTDVCSPADAAPGSVRGHFFPGHHLPIEARIDEQALVSLKIKETVDAGVGRTKAVIING